GILTGLIGEQGAIGAFLSGTGDKSNITGGTDADNGFAGGFVAGPPPVVDTGDLPTYPTKPNEVTGSGFVTATETGLNITDIQFVGEVNRRIILNPLFIGRRGGAGTTETPNTNPDGFAYFLTTNANNDAIAGYAGILATTNLGAPLPSTTASAVWAGHFSVGTDTNIATDYYVNFSTGEFGFNKAAGNRTEGEITRGDLTYTMNAVFGSHASAMGFNAGQMGGTLNLSENSSGVISTNSADITGLIGAEGAVGVFAQVGRVGGITGGFTATNPDYTPPE
nr:hypothetical protein [Pseudomonadota bacterium]